MEHLLHRWDVTIIGGGLAGLTAANFLARANKKVLVLEKADQLGGRARTENKAGCFLNLGPHAWYKKGPGNQILKELGIRLQGGTPGVKGVLVHEGEKFRFPSSPVSLLASQLLSWKEKKEFVKLMVNIQKANPATLPAISLHDWAEKHIHEERVRKLFFLLCRLTTYSNNPNLTSAAAAIGQLKRSLGGVLYVDGGWQTIIEKLRTKALQANAVILENQRVVRIEGSSPKMRVILADGRMIETECVISTASPVQTYQMVPNAEQTSLRKIKDRFLPVKGACLDLAVSRLPHPSTLFAMDLDHPFYFSVHSSFAKLSDHPDHAVIHLYKYLEPDEAGNTDLHKKELEEFMDLLQPGWRNHLIFARYLPNMTVSHRLPTAGGEQENYLEIKEIPGLYIAGDWATSRFLLADAAIYSAKEVALMIMNRDKEARSVV